MNRIERMSITKRLSVAAMGLLAITLLWSLSWNSPADAAPFSSAVEIVYDGGLVTAANPLPVSGSVSVDTSTLATSSNQTTGSQKTRLVDISGNTAPSFDTASRSGYVRVTDGTNTQPTGDTAARPIFAKLSDGTVAFGTSSVPMVVAQNPIAGTDLGQNLSLNDTASHTFSSTVASVGCWVSAPLANTAAIYCAFSSSVTTSTGIELQPGDREFFPVTNANKISCITGTATQNDHAACL